ncbi:MAG: hypothetical protein V1662_02920 [Candidatus Omnitrophota bacterium]
MYKIVKDFPGGKNGQALVELAALGTVLIFCLGLLMRYGMTENYSQEATMGAFRKAFVRARSGDTRERKRGQNAYNPGWAYENTNPPLPSNHWRNVQYVVINDKIQPSTAGVLSVDERLPAGAAASAVCSQHMFHEIDSNDDLPRVEYEINGKRYSFSAAAIVTYQGVNNNTVKTKKNKDPWDGTGSCWQWERVDNPEKGMMADVDNDNFEEFIMDVHTGNILSGVDRMGNPITVVNPQTFVISGQLEENYFFMSDENDVWKPIDGNPHIIAAQIDLTPDEAKRATDDFITVRRAWVQSGFWYVPYRGQPTPAQWTKLERVLTFKFTDWELAFRVIDYQRGDINSEGVNNGLQDDFSKRMTLDNPSTFIHQEDQTAITTTEQINSTESVDRVIKTSPGAYTPDGNYEVNDVFPVQKTTTWQTPHK